MDYQLGFNIAIGLAGFLGGWVLKNLHEVMRDLQEDDKEIIKKISEIEVLVAGEYVKKDDLAVFSSAIFSKLDRIEERLISKADKQREYVNNYLMFPC